MSVLLPFLPPTSGRLTRCLVLVGLASLMALSGFAQNPPFNSNPTIAQTAVCAGGTITVSFTALPPEQIPTRIGEVGTFDFGLQYRAQLSDAMGVFDGETLTDLGEVKPGINHNVYIPEYIPTGTSYRVRIVLGYLLEPCSDCGPPSRIGIQAELENFEVFVISNPSLKFRISQPSFPAIPTVSSDNKCPGQTVRLSFTIACKFFSENSFTAQLSNAMGSFESPVNLGSVKPGTLNNVMIPWGTPAGTGYKIRVVSSNPEVTSAASANFKVKSCNNNTREAALEEVGLQVRISPNPATDGRLKITLSGVEGQKLNVALFNGTGQPVRQQAIERAGEEELLDWDITRQPQGLYLLRVSSGKEAKTVKVVH